MSDLRYSTGLGIRWNSPLDRCAWNGATTSIPRSTKTIHSLISRLVSFSNLLTWC